MSNDQPPSETVSDESTATDGGDSQIDAGVAAMRAQKWDEAERIFEAVLEAEPERPDALRRLGTVQHLLGRHEQAIELIQKALEQNDEDPDAHINIGVVLRDMGRHGEAVGHFARALQIAPDDPDGHFNLGLSGLALGDNEDALLRFQRALELKPDDQDAKIHVGIALKETSRILEAIEVLREAVSMDRNNPRAHYECGSALLADGWPIDALEHFRAAVRLRPEFTEAINLVGVSLGQMGDLAGAQDAFRKALELRPGDERFERNLREASQRLVPGWHLPMINDLRRNDAFQEAIERAAGSIGDGVVLDIGTGSGLLAMMAARGGAKRVVACEALAPLATVAREIVAANGYDEQITVIAKKSTHLVVGEDLPEPAALIIAEVFDTALIGEGVLPTIRHAVANLGSPDARVIPAGASAWGVLIEIPDLRRINPVGEINGFDLSAMDVFRNPTAHWVFDREHHEHTELTEPFEIARFDFKNPPSGENHQRETLQAIAEGTAHAVAMWFDLHLDERTTFSSKPGTPLDHWHHNVMFLDRDKPLKKGQRFELNVGHNDARFIITTVD